MVWEFGWFWELCRGNLENLWFSYLGESVFSKSSILKKPPPARHFFGLVFVSIERVKDKVSNEFSGLIADEKTVQLIEEHKCTYFPGSLG